MKKHIDAIIIALAILSIAGGWWAYSRIYYRPSLVQKDIKTVEGAVVDISAGTAEVSIKTPEGKVIDLVLSPDMKVYDMKNAPVVFTALQRGMKLRVTGVFTKNDAMVPDSIAIIGNAAAGALGDFEVLKPELIIRGANLSKVELWAVPAGTGITEKDFIRLGDATLAAEDSAGQTWRFLIPKDPVSATSIFAKGFDGTGIEAGRVQLPFTGEAKVADALWGGEQDGHYTITEKDKGKTLTYGLTTRFTVILDGKKYPKEKLSCAPDGVIGSVSNIPSVALPLYAARFEGVQIGTCTLKDGVFSVTIKIREHD